MEVINGYLLTEKETKACIELIRQMRAEEEHKRLVQKRKTSISFEISASINEIGLDETKKIVRELNRELKDLK